MSNGLRDAVWDNGPTDPTMKFVLMSICDRADDKGYCWPSHNDTAKRTGYTRRTVINAMSRLEDEGWISTEVRYKRGRERTSNGVLVNTQMLLGSELNSLGSEIDSLGVVNDVHWGSELNSPESFIESIKEIETTPPTPIEAIREYFVTQTALQPNDRTGTFEREWSKPLEKLLQLAHGDPAAGCALVDRALAVARGDNDNRKVYTVTCPRSILSIATNLAAAQGATASAADDDSLWQRAVQAVTRRDYSDERLKAAIRAIGGTSRIATANGHDAANLKRQLGAAYRAPAPTG